MSGVLSEFSQHLSSVSSGSKRDALCVPRSSEREPRSHPDRNDKGERGASDDDHEQLEAAQTFAFHTHVGP